MTLNDLVFLPLMPGETDFSHFDCGRDDINDFFLNDASDTKRSCLERPMSLFHKTLQQI